VAEAFGAAGSPRRISGGQGTTYRIGDIVLKPAEGLAAATWMAEVHDRLPDSPLVRFARPVRAMDGGWVAAGYAAWTFLEGELRGREYERKLEASLEYHRLLASVGKPGFLDAPASSWAAADLVATGERPFAYDEPFMALYAELAPRLRPLNLPFQVIHGDLSGNFLLCEGSAPAVIDLSPAWAPARMAEGIMLADVITWENAEPHALCPWMSLPEMEQFAWRGIVRRIAEQAEHVRFIGKDRNQAVADAREFRRAIEMVSALFAR
jgi:uncharacterized protein (TIGR02569 family)